MRKPNQEELRQLERFVLDEMGSSVYPEDVESVKRLVRDARIAVFDDYVSDSPGYRGKVMMVVWPGGPSFYQALVWENGTVVAIEQDS